MRDFFNSFLDSDNNTYISSDDVGSVNGFLRGSSRISPSTAQRIVNVFGCVNIKANALSIIPIKVYKRLEKGGKESDRKNPLYKLLRYKPNPNLTASEWKKMLSQDLDLRGNHYCQIIWNKDATPKAIYPLKADLMKVEWGKNRNKIYTYDNKKVADYQILHLMDIPDSEGLKGLTRIEVAREALEFADNASRFGNKVFKNNASISGVFSHKNRLSEEPYQRLKRDLEDKYSGVGNAGKTMLLEEAMTFTPIEMKNSDAQWIESRKLNREEIATLFGVPVSMLNDATNTAFGNLEQKEQSFYSNTVLPIITLCEERFYLNFLLTEKQQDEISIKFNYNALMRADTKTRAEYFKAMHGISSINANQIRNHENMNSYEGGEEYFMQTSYDTVNNIVNKGKNNE